MSAQKHYFGLCPTCEGEPTHVHVAVAPGQHRTENWMVCMSCEVRWPVGSGLFTWPHEYAPPVMAESGIAHYRIVESYRPAASGLEVVR